MRVSRRRRPSAPQICIDGTLGVQQWGNYAERVGSTHYSGQVRVVSTLHREWRYTGGQSSRGEGEVSRGSLSVKCPSSRFAVGWPK